MGETKEEVEEKKDEEEEEEEDEEPPTVTLSEEELARKFLFHEIPDITESALATAYNKFSLPQAEEGFDEIRYGWLNGPGCEQYLKNWLETRKETMRFEVEVGTWFKENNKRLEGQFKGFYNKLVAYDKTCRE